MTTSPPPRSPALATDRRGWLGQALAGACATLADPAYAADDSSLGAGVSAPRTLVPASKPPASQADVLASLLQHNHGLRPDYRGGLSNHVSMALYSLSALGASSAQLDRFAEAQWPRLEPLPTEPGLRVSTDDWRAPLGKREALNGYRALFSDAIARDGRDATLRKYLPGLLPGIGAAAFHPLIRTGYGVRFGDDREVADGLAYWATAHLPLGPLGRVGSEHDPRAVLTSVHEARSLSGLELPGHLINGKMKAASLLPEFAPKVNALAPSDTTLAALSAASVRLYLENGDFTALHAVTGTHAYRMLQPFISPSELGLRYLWQALMAAYISIGAPRVVDPASSTAPAWSEMLASASASLDEHDIKLVDVAREQGSFYGDALYGRAAARRLALI